MTITDEMVERAALVETEMCEYPYSARHTRGVLLSRAMHFVAPSLSTRQCDEEAQRLLRAALEAALKKEE